MIKLPCSGKDDDKPVTVFAIYVKDGEPLALVVYDISGSIAIINATWIRLG